MTKTIGASAFKATCLRVIKDMNQDREPVVVTKHGRPVAIVSPPPVDVEHNLVVGAMRGCVLRYGQPFAPAADPTDWSTLR